MLNLSKFATYSVFAHENLSWAHESSTLSGQAFSVIRLARGGGGLRRPDAKNQGYHEQTEMKLCVSYYNHRSMPDAKFESGSFFYFWRYDVTKISYWRREQVIEFGYLAPENGFNFKKKSYYVQNCPPRFKIDPMSISAIFKQRKIFLFLKFLDVSKRK